MGVPAEELAVLVGVPAEVLVLIVGVPAEVFADVLLALCRRARRGAAHPPLEGVALALPRAERGGVGEWP